MNKHQHFALSHYLRKYDCESTFTDILTKIDCGTAHLHDDYALWASAPIIDRIKEMTINLAKTYGEDNVQLV